MNELEMLTTDAQSDDGFGVGIERSLGTVSELTESGVKIVFDGDDESDGKAYPCNSALAFNVGDRVKLFKDSGTYVVAFTLGPPGSNYPLPQGGSDGQMLVKNGAEPYALRWQTLSVAGTLPTGGTTGQYLKKTSATDYDCEWAALSVAGTLPTGGSSGQYLRKKSVTNYDCEWAALSVAGTLPTGGSSGQYLRKKSVTNYDCEWAAVSVTGGLPTGGSVGQFLSKKSVTNYDCEWTTPPVSGSSSPARIGFMGSTAVSKKSVSKLSTTATLTTVISKVNEVLTDLADYGLITSY